MSAPSLSKAVSSLSDRLIRLFEEKPAASIIQLTQTFSGLPLMSWLASQPLFPKIYWQGRERQEESAALGSCVDLCVVDAMDDAQLLQHYQQQIQAIDNPEIRFYGGLAFDRRQQSWPEFGRGRFVLPRIELRRQGDNYQLLVHLDLRQRPLAEEVNAAVTCLGQLQHAQPLPPPNKTDIEQRVDTPDYPHWQRLVTEVTSPAFNRDTPKVVLSRMTELSVAHTPDPWTVLACWQGRNPTSFQFGFQFSPERSFISCTPERLFRREQLQLITEALAGTTIRGLTPEEDELLAQQLLDDHKNSDENQFVGTHILAELAPLAESVSADSAPRIFKLNHIQHLHRTISAKLKVQTNDFQLLQSLHPTPAVGGLPKLSALNYIAANEGYTRGWYAGACGYLGKQLSEFAVAIRSALLEPGYIKLFAGAGILAGSDPTSEWQELENKIATIMAILNDF